MLTITMTTMTVASSGVPDRARQWPGEAFAVVILVIGGGMVMVMVVSGPCRAVTTASAPRPATMGRRPCGGQTATTTRLPPTTLTAARPRPAADLMVGPRTTRATTTVTGFRWVSRAWVETSWTGPSSLRLHGARAAAAPTRRRVLKPKGLGRCLAVALMRLRGTDSTSKTLTLMPSMAMAASDDFGTVVPCETAPGNGHMIGNDFDVGLTWMTMLLGMGWWRTFAAGTRDLGGGLVVGADGGGVADGAARAQEVFLRRVCRRTPLAFVSILPSSVTVILNSADRAGARLLIALHGPLVQSRASSKAMDAFVGNLKDGVGMSRMLRDPTRVMGHGGPRLRVGSR